MINSRINISTNRWIFAIMIFAFFWLVIGELITLHQKAIYGFDPFTQETPYSKPDNTSSKTDKSQKLFKAKDDQHFDIVILDPQKLQQIISETDFEFNNNYSIFNSQSGHPLIALRAPPLS
jgi:hypothetical protein